MCLEKETLTAVKPVGKKCISITTKCLRPEKNDMAVGIMGVVEGF